MPVNPDKLKEALIKEALITPTQLETCEKECAKDNKTLEDLLIEKNIVPEEKLGKLIANLYQLNSVKLSNLIISTDIIEEIPFLTARTQNIIAFDKDDKSISVAVCDPENKEIIDFVKQKTGLEVKTFYTTPNEIKNKLRSYHRDVHEKFDQLTKNVLKDPTGIDSLKDCSNLLDKIIAFAYESKASDIHIEPHPKNLLIRFRMDGLLHDIINLPNEIKELITTRIKVLANLRTDEHRIPQDGRFKIDIEGDELTLRVSFIPIYDGEKIVLRLLATENKTVTLEDLGYNKNCLMQIADGMRKSHGMILVTGPTGSGKSTTLYAVLKKLNSREVNISTIEDPIEYKIEGVNQIQVNPAIPLTFAMGLRSLLRQDPNIIMVGEIRDNETANIAVNAALTGHLVLATLHTNDAASTLIRLIEMDVEPFLISSTVVLAVAQRLVRNICPKCKVKFEFTLEELNKLSENLKLNMSSIEQLHKIINQKKTEEKIYFYKGEGCNLCANTGYSGRSCIAEVITVNEHIRKLILDNASPDVIKEQAKKLAGMETMMESGIEKAFTGETTIEEILRVMRE